MSDSFQWELKRKTIIPSFFITTALHTFLKHLEKVRKNLSRKKAKIRKIFFSYLTNILAKFSFFFSKLKFEKGSENNAKFRILIFFQTDKKIISPKKTKIFAKRFPHCRDDLLVLQIYKYLFSNRWNTIDRNLMYTSIFINS